MVKYGVELHSLVYPKWAKIRFKLSAKGKLLFIMNPSLTPGKAPEGVRGMVPKGTKVFDYDKEKECLLSLSLAECMKIIDFAKAQRLAETVDLIHVLHGEKKLLKFSWNSNSSGEVSVCNVNYTKKSSDDQELSKIYVPIPFDGIREVVTILNSYVNNFVNVMTLCTAELYATEYVGPASHVAKPSDFRISSDLPTEDDYGEE